MKQESRWSETQLTVLKKALAENETAITAIRKVLLEDDLTPNEAKVLKSSIQDKPAVQELLMRHYLPQMKVDAPIGQVQDRLIAIPVDTLTPEMLTLQASATELAEQCLEAHMNEIFTGEKADSYKNLYKLEPDNPAGTYVGLSARNKYLIDCEKLTHHLFLLAGKKDESPEDTAKRLQMNSAK